MTERAFLTTTPQSVHNAFRLVGLVALVSTAVVWLFLSMSLLWAAAAYAGFLLFIGVSYAAVDYAVDGSRAADSPVPAARR